MKNKIVFIVGVLFVANAGYSEVPYNQNVRTKCPYIYSIATGPVFNENGIIGNVDSWGKFKSDKFIGQVDCYGLVRDSNGKILGSVMKQGETPIYSKNQVESRERLLYVSRPKADGSVIVRTFDGSEFEPNGKGVAAEKEVDRWYTNWTILRNMENVFVNGICKTEYENGFQVTSDFRIENTTTESKKDSVKYNVAQNAKAIIHNHPNDSKGSHAWPSLGDIISGLRNPNIDFYIVDCYDKATLIRFDQNTGKVHKIQDADRETIAVNLEPDFQKEPAYKELMEKIDKVSTLEELEDLLEKKPSKGAGYNHAYQHMPYVPADFELLKKKVMSLRAAEKNKSGTLQNASSKDGDVGVNGHAVDLSQFDQYVQEIILAYKEFNSTLEECVELSETPINISGENAQVTGLRGIVARGNAIEAEKKTRWRKWQTKYEKSIRKLNDKTLALENALQSLKDKDISSDKIIKIRKMLCRPILPYIRKTIEIAKRADSDIADSIINQFSALEKFVSDDNIKVESISGNVMTKEFKTE